MNDDNIKSLPYEAGVRRAFALLSAVWLALVGVAGCGPEARQHYAVRSPSGELELRTYRRTPGAAGRTVEFARVYDVRSGRARRAIWVGPSLDDTPTWLDDRTVDIGSQTLDIRRDRYDWRSATAPPGLASAEEAASTYVRAVLSRDVEGARRASGLPMSRARLVREAGDLFGGEIAAGSREASVAAMVTQRLDNGAQMSVLVRLRSGDNEQPIRLWVVALEAKDGWRVNFAAREDSIP